jgi:hypothetical protein
VPLGLASPAFTHSLMSHIDDPADGKFYVTNLSAGLRETDLLYLRRLGKLVGSVASWQLQPDDCHSGNRSSSPRPAN